MRVLSLSEFLNQPDGIIFQMVHRGKPPGTLLVRGSVARYDKIARFVAAALTPDENPGGPSYQFPPASGAFTLDYSESDDVRFLVMDREDVRTLIHLLRAPLDALHAYERGHADVPHPSGWKVCHPMMFEHQFSRPRQHA